MRVHGIDPDRLTAAVRAMVRAQQKLEQAAKAVAPYAGLDDGIRRSVGWLRSTAGWLEDRGDDARRRVTAIRVADKEWARPESIWGRVGGFFKAVARGVWNWGDGFVDGVTHLAEHSVYVQVTQLAVSTLGGRPDEGVGDLVDDLRTQVAEAPEALWEMTTEGVKTNLPLPFLAVQLREVDKALKVGDVRGADRLTREGLEDWTARYTDVGVSAALAAAGAPPVWKAAGMAGATGGAAAAAKAGDYLGQAAAYGSASAPKRFEPPPPLHSATKDLAVPVGPRREVGLDYDEGWFVRFELDPAGHVVGVERDLAWYQLDPEERAALERSGVVDRSGMPVTAVDGSRAGDTGGFGMSVGPPPAG